MPETATVPQGGTSATSGNIPGESGSAAGAALTDEQILGITEDSQASTEATPRQEDAARKGGATRQEDGRAAETQPKPEDAGLKPGATQAEEIQPGQPLPEWAKQLLADPAYRGIGPKVQQLWDQHQAYRELYPTVAEARAVKELFPGGAEEAKAVHARALALDAADEQFVSGDPAAQGELALQWYQDNPEAFSRMVAVSARLLAEREPETYKQLTEGMFLAALQAERFDKRVDLLREALAKNDGEALKGLVETLVGWAENRGISRRGGPARSGIDPERQAIQQEREKLDIERRALQAEQYGAFHNAAQTSVETQVQQSIQGTLAKVLKDAPFTEGGKKRIAEDIFRQVDNTLRADRGLARQYASIVRPRGPAQGAGWRLDPAAQDAVVSLLVGRAKALIPAVAKQVVAEHTSYLVGANKALIEKKEGAAKRVDIAGGGAPEVRVRPLKPEDVRGMTDEEILDMA